MVHDRLRQLVEWGRWRSPEARKLNDFRRGGDYGHRLLRRQIIGTDQSCALPRVGRFGSRSGAVSEAIQGQSVVAQSVVRSRTHTLRDNGKLSSVYRVASRILFLETQPQRRIAGWARLALGLIAIEAGGDFIAPRRRI